MKRIPNNYIDTIITDPPYGLKFMGKGWDYAVPGPHYWKECLRVAKPGAILMAFGGTRTYHRLTCAIEDAGWKIRDCIQWIYGSGFPKSLDISKAIDKAAGAKRENKRETQFLDCTKDNNPTKSSIRYKKCLKCDKLLFSPDPCVCPQPKPATPLAQQWDGWGTGLKPSWEPIIVAMKPLDGTYAENAEKWGVAGLWIDGGRISGEPTPINKLKNWSGFGQEIKPEYEAQINTKGRFPSNTILDESAAVLLDEQSGELKSGSGNNTVGYQKAGAINSWTGHTKNDTPMIYDSGGASRFFYCAKSSKAERNAGCEGMEAGPPPASARSQPAEGRESALGLPRQNHHPTVKPLALMEYLCKLTKTPTGGIVLDPFAGSGTTGLACLNTQRKFILIEKKLKYIKITKARIRGRKRKRRLFDE